MEGKVSIEKDPDPTDREVILASLCRQGNGGIESLITCQGGLYGRARI